MKLEVFDRIEDATDALIEGFKVEKRSLYMDWAVEEFLDGTHLAIYVDGKNKEFKISYRSKFINEQAYDTGWKEVVRLYKSMYLEMSSALKVPVIIYGKLLGGRYGKTKMGHEIRTVCDYTPYNEFFVHDIKLPHGFMSVREREQTAEKYAIHTAPILYMGNIDKAIAYPNNKLSVIPFISSQTVMKDNEMRGTVIRPAFNLPVGGTGKRYITKRVNTRYVIYMPRKDATKHSVLVGIAQDLSIAATVEKLLDETIAEVGGYDRDTISVMAAKYVQNIVDIIPNVKYDLLNEEEQNEVKKQLNRMALTHLDTLLRIGRAA